ncbi:MAG: hypothetical protein ABW199_11645, partial [Caulobacterales bacterium]
TPPSTHANSAWNQLDEATRNQRNADGMKAWQDWQMKYADVILEQGGPLGKTKRVDASGVRDTSNLLTGYIVVRADSHEAAARMFENHPHFAFFPGDSVEVMECLPMPGQ